jgi:hypothetical protein
VAFGVVWLGFIKEESSNITESNSSETLISMISPVSFELAGQGILERSFAACPDRSQEGLGQARLPDCSFLTL